MVKFSAFFLMTVALCASTADALQCFTCMWNDFSPAALGTTMFGDPSIASMGDPSAMAVGGDSRCRDVGVNSLPYNYDADFPASPMFCFKLVTITNGLPDLVVRMGGTREKLQQLVAYYGFAVPTNGCAVVGTGIQIGTLCSCNTDGCNGSKQSAAAAHVVLIATAFTVFLKQSFL